MKRTNSLRKFSDSDLYQNVPDSFSWGEVGKKLGYKTPVSGPTKTRIRIRCEELGIPYSHFTFYSKISLRKYFENYPAFGKRWSSRNPDWMLDELSAGSRKEAYFICPTCQQEELVSIQLRAPEVYQNACTCCSGMKVVEGVNDLATIRPDLVLEWSSKNEMQPSEITTSSRFYAEWDCYTNPEHNWKASVHNRTSKKTPTGCPRCSHKISKAESKLCEHVESLGFAVEKNDRKIIAPYEIDIWIPSQNLGIEFNGTYWHGEEMMRKKHGMSAYDFHARKLDLANQSGIDLIFVWEDDWESENETTKELLGQFLTDRNEELKSSFSVLSKD